MSLDLEAIEEIRQQKAKYCRYLDTKQFDAWEGLFKPDAEIIFYNLDDSVMEKFESIASLSAVSRDLFATAKTIHQIHNSEIEFESPTVAKAIWSMEDWHIYASDGYDAPKTMHGYGFYYETWERIGDEWKLARMELRRNLLFRS